MSTYPFDTTVYRGTKTTASLPPQIDRSVFGSARARSFAVLFPRQFTLMHILDDEELNLLLQFYDENSSIQFDFIWERTGETVVVFFSTSPKYKTLRAALYEVVVSLVEDTIPDPNPAGF